MSADKSEKLTLATLFLIKVEFRNRVAALARATSEAPVRSFCERSLGQRIEIDSGF